MKVQGRPAYVDSPWMEWKISETCTLLPIGSGGSIRLPDLDLAHADGYRRRVFAEAARHLLIEVAGQVFGRGIQLVEGRDIVHELVVQLVDDGLHQPFHCDEIAQQAGGIELGAAQGDADFVVVAVHILTLAPVPAQGVPGREAPLYGNLKHRPIPS